MEGAVNEGLSSLSSRAAGRRGSIGPVAAPKTHTVNPAPSVGDVGAGGRAGFLPTIGGERETRSAGPRVCRWPERALLSRVAPTHRPSEARPCPALHPLRSLADSSAITCQTGGLGGGAAGRPARPNPEVSAFFLWLASCACVFSSPLVSLPSTHPPRTRSPAG